MRRRGRPAQNLPRAGVLVMSSRSYKRPRQVGRYVSKQGSGRQANVEARIPTGLWQTAPRRPRAPRNRLLPPAPSKTHRCRVQATGHSGGTRARARGGRGPGPSRKTTPAVSRLVSTLRRAAPQDSCLWRESRASFPVAAELTHEPRSTPPCSHFRIVWLASGSWNCKRFKSKMLGAGGYTNRRRFDSRGTHLVPPEVARVEREEGK